MQATQKHNGPHARPIAERIRASVEVDENGCWRWQLYVRPNGYGQIGVPGLGIRYAHRISYETFRGSIPDGLTIDHLCRVRDCVNPEHLEAVTNRENLVRGTGFTAQHAAATCCRAGHPFDEENTYVTPNGSRNCRKCKVAAHARWRARRREA